MPIVEVATTVAQCFPSPIEVRIAKTPDPNSSPERYVPSTKRAQEECGIRQLVDLMEGIRRTVRYLQSRYCGRSSYVK